MPTATLPAFALPSFNPLDFANRLKKVGVPEKQAEAEAEILHEAITHYAEAFLSVHNQLASSVEATVRKAEQTDTKTEAAIARLENKIGLMESKLDARFDSSQKALDTKTELLRKEIIIARRDTIIWLGGMLVVGCGLILRFLTKLPV